MKLLILLVFMCCSFFAKADEDAIDTWFEGATSCSLNLVELPNSRWDGTTKLPIDILEVGKIFERWSKKKFDERYDIFISSYELVRTYKEVSLDNAKTVWLYKIKFVTFLKNKPATPFNRKIAINLDGQVIEPRCSL